MSNYRVAILAAGLGSRAGSKAARNHKALLRVGTKAVLSHIIDIFPPDVTFVIGVGHRAHLIREYLGIIYDDRKFVFVDSDFGPGRGPGYTLGQCGPHLQTPFFYFDCDTLIPDFPIDDSANWVACAEIPQSAASQYCTVMTDTTTGRVTGIRDKDPSGATLAWTGAAFVKDYGHFWDALAKAPPVRGEYQIAPALFSLSGLWAKRVVWFDTGNEAGLAIAREAFQTVGNLGREDEEIYFHGGHVIKYYEDSARLEKIVARMKMLGPVAPIVENASPHFIKYRYTPGHDLSRDDALHERMPAFLDFCERSLWVARNLAREEFKARCLRFYRDKIIGRVRQAFANLSIVDCALAINGRKIPALEDILLTRIDWDRISDGLASSVHGDLNLSNVILTPEGGFALVDCREDFGGGLDSGDRYYDFAKIYQSLLWPHRSVRDKTFRVERWADDEVTVVVDIPPDVAKAKEIFEEWARSRGYDVRRIQLLSAMTLVNIAALHDPSLAEPLLYYGWHCLYDFVDGGW